MAFGVLACSMKYQTLFFLFQNSHGCREFKELCENLIFTKHGVMILGIMKLLVLLPHLHSHKLFIFSVFWVNFFFF